MKPTIGSIAIYTLTSADAEQINRRRTTGKDIAARIPEGKWPMGAQAHIGNEVREGNEFPMVIVRVWDPTVQGQVLLDGNDTFWATSRAEQADGEDPKGRWRWPVRA